MRFRRRKPQGHPVVFKDKAGRLLAPWAVRAGMTITATDYRHSDRSLVCVVDEPDDPLRLRREQILGPVGRSEDADPRTGEAY